MKKKIIVYGAVVTMCILMVPSYALGTSPLFLDRELNLHPFEPPQQTQTDDPWSMFHHDAMNTGCTSSYAPFTNKLKWKHSIEEEILSSIPILDDGKIYVSTGWYYLDFTPPKTGFDPTTAQPSFDELISQLITYNDEYYGGVFCLDAETGEELWNYPMYAPNDPAVIDNRLYVTDIDPDSYDSSLYCLDATTGALIWTKVLSGLATSPMIIENDRIYISCLNLYSYSSVLFCYDINGNILGTYLLPYHEVIWFSAPALHNGNIYFITADIYTYYTGKLYCLDAITFQYKWSQTVFTFFFFGGATSPVAKDGKIYMYDFNIGSYYGYIKCFDAETGSMLWSYNLGMTLSLAIPSINDDSIFITGAELYSYFTWLYCISLENHTLTWKSMVPTGSYFFGTGSPICTADKIILQPTAFFYYSSNMIFTYNIENGAPIWYYNLDYESMGTPACANEQIVTSDYMGNIYVFEDQLKMADIQGGLFNVKITLENIGQTDLTNITWTIKVTGGALGKINRVSQGTLESLAAESQKKVRALPVFGIGALEVEAIAALPDVSPAIRKTAQGMAMGPLIMILP